MNMLKLFLIIAICFTICNARKLASTADQRKHAVNSMFERLNKEFKGHGRRRLNNGTANDMESILLDWAYNLELAKQSQMLRSMEVTEEDGLPAEIGNTHLTSGYHDATAALGRFIKQEEEKARRRLKTTDTKKGENGHGNVLPASFRKAKPRYLGEIAKGIHEIDISGAPISAVTNDKRTKDVGRKLGDSDLTMGGTCSEVAMGDVYKDDVVDGVSSSQACTCDSDGILDAGDISISLGGKIPMKQRYCKCSQSTTGLFPVNMYSYVGWKCTQYPSIASGSKCTVDESSFPKSVKCKYILVLMEGVWVTFGMSFGIGFGHTGRSDDIVATFKFGATTNMLPRPCMAPNVPTVQALESDQAGAILQAVTDVVTCADKLCYILEFIAQIVQKEFDLAKTLGGTAAEGTVKYYPFQLKYPATYDGSTDDTKMQLFARIPLISPASAKISGTSASLGDVDIKTTPICISNIASKMTEGGGLQRQAKYIAVALGMLGSDFCIETPGVEKSGAALLMGLKITGKAFDKSMVSLTKFIDIMPEAWEKTAEDISGVGLKTLLTNAVTFKPFPSLTGFTDWSLDSQFKDTITGAWPSQFDVEIDIGEIVGGETPSLMKGTSGDDAKIFKFDNMFVTGRRRLQLDENLGERDVVTLDIPEGLLKDIHPLVGRKLAADNSFDFPAGTTIKSGSKCELSYSGMPKAITCTLKAGLSDAVTIETVFKVVLGYDLSGSNLEMVSKFGFKTSLGSKSEYTNAGVLDKIDVGGLIDDSLSGTVTLMPFGIQFPKDYSTGGLHEVGRVTAALMLSKGVCIDNMYELADDDMKVTIQAMTDMLSKAAAGLGGSFCVKTPGLSVTDGFKLGVDGDFNLFDKSIVDVWPIISTLGDNVPAVKLLLSIIQSVFGDTIKTTINDLVKGFLPAVQQFKISMGMLIANALKLATTNAISGDKLPGGSRRLITEKGRVLSSTAVINADGTFNLGGIPASTKPGVSAIGTPITSTISNDDLNPAIKKSSSGGSSGAGGANGTNATGVDGKDMLDGATSEGVSVVILFICTIALFIVY